MTDGELLEKAATAAGFQWRWFGEHFCTQRNPELATYAPWKPLTDDGDALRLAVRLGLEIRQVHFKAHAGHAGRFWETESYADDPEAATRRAIVRASAALIPLALQDATPTKGQS